jgi:hypothetical protein
MVTRKFFTVLAFSDDNFEIPAIGKTTCEKNHGILE